MKFLLSLSLLLSASLLSLPSFAGSGGGLNEEFTKVIYVKSGGSATNSGTSYDAAKSCAADADLWDIPANTLVTKVFLVVDTAITGTTTLDFGDDDDPNGFFDGGTSGLEGASLVAGLYGWDAKGAGADLRIQTAGVTDAADVYVVPNAKYYSAAGKEVKMDLTTACTAGRFRLYVQGFRIGSK